MDVSQFDCIVLQHKNNVLLIGGILLFVCVIAMLFVEIYVRGVLECKYFSLWKHNISPTLLLLIPMLAILVWTSVDVVNCSIDMTEDSYEIYIGVAVYDSESVKLSDENITIYVGKGHEIVPYGEHYGKCIYSRRSKVIVYWENLDDVYDDVNILYSNHP